MKVDLRLSKSDQEALDGIAASLTRTEFDTQWLIKYCIRRVWADISKMRSNRATKEVKPS